MRKEFKLTNLPESKISIDMLGIAEMIKKYGDEIDERQKIMDNKPLIGLEVFEELGIFRSAENSIARFRSLGGGETSHISYSINFCNNSKHIEGFTSLKHSGINFPTLSYNPNTNEVSRTYGASINAMPKTSVTLEKLSEVIRRRFSSRKIELVNGWGIMHYLDFLTDFRLDWSDDVIKIIDNQVSNGIPLNKIVNLIFIGVPLDKLEECLSLPFSWVEKAYTSAPTWEAKLAEMIMTENTGNRPIVLLPPRMNALSGFTSIYKQHP